MGVLFTAWGVAMVFVSLAMLILAVGVAILFPFPGLLALWYSGVLVHRIWRSMTKTPPA